MKLFLYYAFCSVKNQIRRLFKTWVAVFILVCMLFGFIIGFGAALLDESLSEGEDPGVSDEGTDSGEYEEDIPLFEISAEEVATVSEVAAALLFILIVGFNLVMADKSGNSLFNMADVNLLFAAPMKPQSVALFKLLTQIFVTLFASIYFAIEIPKSFIALGFGAWPVIAVFIGWIAIVTYSRLVAVLVYSVVSTRTELKKFILPITFAVGIVIASVLGISYLKTGDILVSLTDTFSSPLTRLIPLYGWVKGLVGCAVSGEVIKSLVYLLLIIISVPLLAYLIWHIKADFYEDAMEKAKSTAEKLSAASEGRTKKRDTDRRDTLIRDGMRRGRGASVFFHKAMYNRYRFSFLHIFTKTSITYFTLAGAAALLLKIFAGTSSFFPVGLLLAGIAFFRSLGNPLGRDVETPYFITVPATAHAKVFWSMLAGTVSVALDLIPAVILSAAVLGASPIEAFVFYLLAIAVDLYASAVMLFIDLSLPTAISLQVKQIISIMFIYFGLIPIAGIIIAGFIFDMFLLFVAIAAIFGAMIGALAMVLAPIFLERGRK